MSVLLERPAAPGAVRTARRGDTVRLRTTWALLALAVLAVLTADVLLGRYPVPLPDLVRIASGEVVPPTSFILLEDKLPRAVVGLLVAVIQAATQLQEQTLQYTLKFFAIVLTIFLTASLVAGSLLQFGDNIFSGFSGMVR